MKNSLRSFLHVSVVCAVSVGLMLLTGCGLGAAAAPSAQNAVISNFGGVAHGGPTPIINARVVLYATTSNGYGAIATALAEADQQGPNTHQDTDVNGVFHFTNNFTCPTGQFAYVVIYGGNTGANANNPNSLLMAPIGSCDSMYTGTTYNGGFLVVNELSTIASAYALNNFMTVNGNAASGYTVNIGAPATNNAASGCVANSYYPGCTTTSAAGLKHAFATAMALVNSSGQANTTTPSGAIIPAQFINTLGNIVEMCVNSAGGGTNISTGAPTTTTTSSGTTHDGTACGKLFAFTSYTLNGAFSGTLVAAGNTLDALKNLAHRPSGSATLFNSTCDSGSTGTITAAACIFGLQAANIYYTNPGSMSSAPSDWMLGISYPPGSFSTGTNSTACIGGITPATNGILNPEFLATDINDNIIILNTDSGGTEMCYNLLSIANDGTSLGGNAFDNTASSPAWISTDSFGHAIVPVHNTSVTASNGVRIYGAGDSDILIPLLESITTTASSSTPALPAASKPYWTAVDGNDTIYVSARNSANDFGILTVSGTESHSLPSYTAASVELTSTPTYVTGNVDPISIDINNNVFTVATGAGNGKTYMLAANGGGASTSVISVGTLTGTTANGVTTVEDTSGHVWNLQTPNAATSQSSPSTSILAFKQTYSVTSKVPTLSTATQAATLSPGAYQPQTGTIDGNNVIWVADLRGQTTTSPVSIYISNLHGYDTVNSFDTGAYAGCKFFSTTSTACGSQSIDATYPSNLPYLLYGTRGIAIDAAGNIWAANGAQAQVNEIIGLAAPTWPLFIHNGASNKP